MTEFTRAEQTGRQYFSAWASSWANAIYLTQDPYARYDAIVETEDERLLVEIKYRPDADLDSWDTWILEEKKRKALTQAAQEEDCDEALYITITEDLQVLEWRVDLIDYLPPLTRKRLPKTTAGSRRMIYKDVRMLATRDAYVEPVFAG